MMNLRVAGPIAFVALFGCGGSAAPSSSDGGGGGASSSASAGGGRGDGGSAATASGGAGGGASPVTTKTALDANDTSASSLFVDTYTPATRFHGSQTPVSNGDAPPGAIDAATLTQGRVSKVSVHTLVGALPVFAETQSWFCTNGKSPLGTGATSDQCGSHIDIGYASNSTARVEKQVADMRSRGIDGVLVDWDGQGAGLGEVDTATTSNAAINTGALTLYRKEAEASKGAFSFAVIEDEGIKACAGQAGCDVSQALVSDIGFLATHFFGSPAYSKKNGRPLLFFFSIDTWVENDGKSIDWGYVRAHVNGNPLFVFENAGGFTHDASDGAYSWLQVTGIGSYPGSDPFGVAGFLPYFYQQASSHPSLVAWGSAWKGFDDNVVNGWGGGRRYAGQQCGKTWLDTMAAATAQGSRLDGVQIATWDDYEEGSEVETGIDNHLAITGAFESGALTFSLAAESGAPDDCTQAIAAGLNLEETIDHYAIYASKDGEHLELLEDDVSASARKVEVGAKIPPGTTSLFVYAVGKPMIHDHLSAAIMVP